MTVGVGVSSVPGVNVGVADAVHKVAGDRNDAFTTAVVDFLQRVMGESADSTAA